MPLYHLQAPLYYNNKIIKLHYFANPLCVVSKFVGFVYSIFVLSPSFVSKPQYDRKFF